MAEILITGIDLDEDEYGYIITKERKVFKLIDKFASFKSNVLSYAQTLPPHGRLGDLDKLYEVATAHYGNLYGFKALIKDIKNAPTVIEASCETS